MVLNIKIYSTKILIDYTDDVKNLLADFEKLSGNRYIEITAQHGALEAINKLIKNGYHVNVY